MDSTLGKRIATHRKRLGLTQEQLAEKLGITAQAVSKWENDQSCPDISALPLLADIFGVSTDTLLGRAQIPAVMHSEYSSSNQTNADLDDDDFDDEVIDDDYVTASNGENQTHSKKSCKERFIDTGKFYLLGTAVWFLAIGILFLCAKLFDWECTFWDILWPSFLLIFGVFGLIKHISLFPLACTSVGIFFLVNNIVPLPIDLDKGILWAIIIIFCGIMLLLDALRKKYRKVIKFNSDAPSHEYWVEDGFLTCSNSFGDEHQHVISDLLRGGRISNSFGDYTVDFSGVKAVSPDCKIEVSCSFGDLTLLIPKQFTVIHKASKSFADFSVSGSPNDISDGVVYLSGSVSFGDLTIKYI